MNLSQKTIMYLSTSMGGQTGKNYKVKTLKDRNAKKIKILLLKRLKCKNKRQLCNKKVKIVIKRTKTFYKRRNCNTIQKCKIKDSLLEKTVCQKRQMALLFQQLDLGSGLRCLFWYFILWVGMAQWWARRTANHNWCGCWGFDPNFGHFFFVKAIFWD